MDLNSTIRFIKELKPASISRFRKLNQPPILICGCGRSGTSMLLSILGAHPNVHAIGIETNIFNQPRRWSTSKLNHLNHMRKISDFLLRGDIKESADRWLEKTPTNVWYIPELLEEFGAELKIIHIVRDGRDVCTSVHPTKKGHYWVRPERWIRDVQLGLAYREHPQMYTIKYEDIIADTEGSMRPLIEFLGLNWDADILNHSKKTTVRTINAWEGEVKAVYNSSVEKWRKPEHAEVVAEFRAKESELGLLKALNYE